MKTQLLNNAYLRTTSPSVQLPEYERDKLNIGILHIGVGAFHRSHQALYTNELIEKINALSWGICGIGLLPADKELFLALKKQDYLYTVQVKEPAETSNTVVVGSMREYIFGPDDPESVFKKIADPKVKIITLTITEGGYSCNQTTGELDNKAPNIQYDLQNPGMPKTVYGYLRKGLIRRMKNEGGPLTILSCDNIQHNGDMMSRMLLSFLSTDKPLQDWVQENITFPNCMVDRITPITTPEDRQLFYDSFQLIDHCLVVCESFRQWIIEDKFISGRPEWEKVGVQFVDDVGSYEKMKLQLLNAGHSVLGFLGSLCGYIYVHEAAQDELLSQFLKGFMDYEVTPVLDPVPGIDLEKYKKTVLERFTNPFIKDQLRRICLESSAKIPKFILPTINNQLEKGGSLHRSALVVAAWCVYCMRPEINGKKWIIEDVMAKELQEKALESRKNRLAFLKITAVFGNLIEEERFTIIYEQALDQLLNSKNVREIIAARIGSESD